MLNHTYTSVKNANLVDCGKKQHIPSQPIPLLKDKFLGEFRTELDKKKVLANLGIVTDLLLEWEYIKGDIGKSESLMSELDKRTRYISLIDGFEKSLIDGIKYLEGVIGGEEEGESAQNKRLDNLESVTTDLSSNLDDLKTYLENTIEVDIETIETQLNSITEKVNNITELIKVSTKANNALVLVGEEELAEGETPGLYVPDLSSEVIAATQNIETLQTNVETIQESLDTFVTKEELGGGDFDFVSQDDFDNYVDNTNEQISDIKSDLENTVKTGEDGHVDTLYVNTISKDNDNGNIQITDSFEVTEGIPLDVRFVVENLDELKALNPNVCYSGMGVIVNELSSLYILRKPAEGVIIDQEYISDEFNWKCPEDLVTVAITREDYDALTEINPHVFYYIYEEEIALTQEPKRESFPEGGEGDAQFAEAWQEWTASLKVLSQEYMSASWGVEIESKLGQKASNDQVNVLAQEIANLKGGGEGATLETLSAGVAELKEDTTILTERLDEILLKEGESETGRLVTAEQKITEIEENLDNYVTKDSLTNDTGESFIFLKEETYRQEQESFRNELAQEITTETINVGSVNIQDAPLIKEGNKLNFNSQTLAVTEDIPVLEVISQEDYNALGDTIKDDVYYYTYDSEETLITRTEFNEKNNNLQNNISIISSELTKVLNSINAEDSGLEALNNKLNDLIIRITALESLHSE